MQILDFIWPSLYIASSVFQFWFLILATISIEAVCFKYFAKAELKRSIVVSVIGNLVSGLIGTVFMATASLLYHTIADTLLFESTFNPVNWIASYLIMCFGSILLEVIAVKLIWKYKFKELILPLGIGNVLSYAVIIALNNFNIFYNGIN
ncbi:MAG: hypothetical protein HOP31_06905 [Ignavibacteria bacterium]|nr:hypothetical protein [Ignavibacteria bacterium]